MSKRTIPEIPRSEEFKEAKIEVIKVAGEMESKGEVSTIQVTRHFKVKPDKDGDVVELIKEGGETADVISVLKFPDGYSPSHVSFNVALTINLGDYESVKVGVMVTVPCYLEENPQAYEFVRRIAMERIMEEKKKIETHLVKKGKT